MATRHDQPAGPEGSYPSPPLHSKDTQDLFFSSKRGPLSEANTTAVAISTGSTISNLRESSDLTMVASLSEQEVVKSVIRSVVEPAELNLAPNGVGKASPNGSVPENISNVTLSHVSVSFVIHL